MNGKYPLRNLNSTLDASCDKGIPSIHMYALPCHDRQFLRTVVENADGLFIRRRQRRDLAEFFILKRERERDDEYLFQSLFPELIPTPFAVSLQSD